MSHKTTYQICKEHPAFQTIRTMAESIKHPTKGVVFSNNNPSYNPNEIKFMNVKQTLQNIRDYIGKNRRVGHTTAMILGANNVDNVLVLAQTHSQARMLQKKIPRAEVASITNPACLEAKSKPLVLDNYTLWSIVSEALQEIERLERKIAELTKQRDDCPESAWIAVSERLPKVGLRVLVCYTNRRLITIAKWQPAKTIDGQTWEEYPEEWEDEDGDTITNPTDLWVEYPLEIEQCGFVENVTHWMPLPSLPNEKCPSTQP